MVLVLWSALGACGQENDVPPTGFTVPTGVAGFGSVSPSPCDSPGAGSFPRTAPSTASGSTLLSPELIGPVVVAETPPPPISGGTLYVSRDKLTLVAADPDRDAVYVINTGTRALERRIALKPGDEPGRIAEDSAGRIHVALRGGHALATFQLGSTAAPRRSEVCDLPRGVAYDATRDRLYVACAEGVLVQVDPANGVPLRRVDLGRDLRDVIVRDDGLYVTRFRTAELLVVNPEDGTLMDVRTQPKAAHVDFNSSSFRDSCGGRPESLMREVESTPDVAWRAIDLPNRGIAMLHQRAQVSEVGVSVAGGYGAQSSCGQGIVRGAITVSAGAGIGATVEVSQPGLLVDMSVDPSGQTLAIANGRQRRPVYRHSGVRHAGA
jgi:hypothetical protein